MRSKSQPLCIPYATDTANLVQIERIVQRQGRCVAASPFPVVVVDPTRVEPHRFNNSIYPDAAEAPSKMGHLEVLQWRLHRQCRPWDHSSVSFIDRYLAFLVRCLNRDDVLSQRVIELQGLFTKDDWLFSAPRPLPRAHVPIRPGRGECNEATLIPVDFAFWLGDRLSVALSLDTKLSPFRAAARRAALEESGIRVRNFGSGSLGEDDIFFEDLLDGAVSRFWRMEALPRGPATPDIPDFF